MKFVCSPLLLDTLTRGIISTLEEISIFSQAMGMRRRRRKVTEPTLQNRLEIALHLAEIVVQSPPSQPFDHARDGRRLRSSES